MAFDRRETALLILGDFVILAFSLWAALSLRNFVLPAPSYFYTNFVPFLPVFFLSLLIFYIAGLYEKQTRPIRRIMGPRILQAQFANVIIAAVLFFVLPLSIAPKTILVLYLVVSVALESVWRFYRMNHEIKFIERTPVILVGSGPATIELYDEVNNNNKYLIRFVEIVEKYDSAANKKEGIAVMYAASLYEEIFDRVPLEYLDAEQFLESVPTHYIMYDAVKRSADIVLAIFGSVIAIPFVFIAALLLSFNGGMPFILHERIGKNGRTFRILKLRSMLLNDHGDPELQKKNKVTRLGKLLRKSRVDELPQLWNVFVGDISFIGPRPELPKIAEVYEREITQYRMRHLIAPGLSGWAQINDADPPRGGADVARTMRKLSFDLYYLKHRSFGLDLAIAMKTIRTLLSFSGT